MKPFVLGIATAAMLTSGACLAQSSPNNAASSGNSNQAVVTASTNAATPAKGANSYTMGQARSRIEKEGFSNVTGLAKDNDGIWHGQAQKGGNTTPVWLDYKGNVGQAN